MEVLNRENCSFLDNHEIQITQLLLCNNFISLSGKIFNIFKEIINSKPNFNRVKKIIELSYLLNEMKNPEYKKNLFSHKLENISNSKHLVLICSIIYEEIFNTKLNNSQLPIRENIQPLEDIFYNNSNKINKIISLSLEITNKTCKIIRAGKGLYSELNTNLFDLFPLAFKEYQIDLFMDRILKFENMPNKVKTNDIRGNKAFTKAKSQRMNTKNIKSNIISSKNKSEFVEIQLILSENILSKMYYKLLTLKLTPLFNNDNNNFILLDGLYYFRKNIVITHQDFDENQNAKEEILGVSEPKLEKESDKNSMSMPFKKYVNWQNNKGYMLSKILSFNKSLKYYHIYHITKKDKEIMKKKVQKNLDENKENNESEEEEEQIYNHKNKSEKMKQLIEDNASVSSQQAGSSFSGGVTSLKFLNKKNENIFEYGGFNKLRKIIFFIICSAIILLIFEYFYLVSLKNDNNSNNNSLLEYREFDKLYFQLFSSTLGIACIYQNKCISLTGIYIDKYLSDNPEELFNYTLFILIKNQILSKEFMEKRNYLNNIHKYIGNEEYNKLFGREINYYRVSQNTYDQKVVFNLTSVKLKFSEAILIICNSFQILNSGNYNPINLLDKPENPFSLLNDNNDHNIYLTDNQKEFYEMLLNYKNYYKAFNDINNELAEILLSKSNFFEVFIYIYLTFNILLILIIETSVHTYTIFFEHILIKIINYINMTINLRNDDFSFSVTFSKKIENLQTILQFDINDPIKGVQNLNNIYSDYQAYLTTKNKSNPAEANKKNYKKLNDNKKNELDDIPKNERIMTKKDVIDFGITSLYRFIFYFNFLMFIIFYIFLLVMWKNYFTKKDNLYELIQKNVLIESSIYRAINIYDLMVFHNYTINEANNMVFSDNNNKEKNDLIKSFYDDLKTAFNSIKEKNRIGGLYQDFEDISNFTCENFLKVIRQNIKEIEENDKEKKLNNIIGSLTKLCKFSKITESNDFRTVFERYFQNLRNGMLSMNDFSYQGIIDHIINDGTLSKYSIIFNCIIIYIIELTINMPSRNSISKLLNILQNQIIISELSFLLLDLIAILFVLFLYRRGINNLCNKFFNLRKVFQIFELQE